MSKKPKAREVRQLWPSENSPERIIEKKGGLAVKWRSDIQAWSLEGQGVLVLLHGDRDNLAEPRTEDYFESSNN